MENTGVFQSEMQSPMNVAEAPEKETVDGSNAVVAAPVVRRRRMRKKGELPKRKRTAIHRDSGFVPPPLPPQILYEGRPVYLFYKKLQNSDVSSLSRIVLPKRSAETYLPWLPDNASIMLMVTDMDGEGAWPLKFRYWPNNESRMYVFEGTASFIRAYGLQTGDYMLVYRDTVCWNYMIRGVKASEVEVPANKEVTATEGSNAADVVPNDTGALVESANFPQMESVAGTSTINDDINDFLKSFSSWDEFEDYYYPPTPPIVTLDNLSGEDLPQVK